MLAGGQRRDEARVDGVGQLQARLLGGRADRGEVEEAAGLARARGDDLRAAGDSTPGAVDRDGLRLGARRPRALPASGSGSAASGSAGAPAAARRARRAASAAASPASGAAAPPPAGRRPPRRAGAASGRSPAARPRRRRPRARPLRPPAGRPPPARRGGPSGARPAAGSVAGVRLGRGRSRRQRVARLHGGRGTAGASASGSGGGRVRLGFGRAGERVACGHRRVGLARAPSPRARHRAPRPPARA